MSRGRPYAGGSPETGSTAGVDSGVSGGRYTQGGGAAGDSGSFVQGLTGEGKLSWAAVGGSRQRFLESAQVLLAWWGYR